MKNHRWLMRCERLILTAWVGSLLAIGYLAVPVLFYQLENRSMAGALAGQMFQMVHGIGLMCGLLLLATTCMISRQDYFKQWRHVVILLMLLLILVALFIMQPQMEAIKLQENWREQAEFLTKFKQLHGISSVMYLATSIMGVVLVLLGLRK